MFKKRVCSRCNSKIKKEFDFCPSCGLKLNTNAKDWGMIGKNDYISENNFFAGGLNSGFLNKMISGTMKMIEKELNKEFEKDTIKREVTPKTRIKLMINGKEVNLEKKPKQEKKQEEKLPINFSQEKLKEFQKFKRYEPKTNLRRIGDKITYEIQIPGIKSNEDISIIKIESGLEVKAIANKKSYLKSIPINMPLLNYSIADGKLLLEMDAN